MALNSGEKKTVEIEVEGLTEEKTAIEIRIGSSSRDVRLVIGR